MNNQVNLETVKHTSWHVDTEVDGWIGRERGDLGTTNGPILDPMFLLSLFLLRTGFPLVSDYLFTCPVVYSPQSTGNNDIESSPDSCYPTVSSVEARQFTPSSPPPFSISFRSFSYTVNLYLNFPPSRMGRFPYRTLSEGISPDLHLQ